jgi:hypothetical protein
MWMGNDDVEALFRETVLLHINELPPDKFVARVLEAGYSARAISAVLARALKEEPPLQGRAATREMLDVLLRIRIAAEQVQAQENMSRAATWLAIAALALPIITAVSSCAESRAQAAANRSAPAAVATSVGIGASPSLPPPDPDQVQKPPASHQAEP